VAFLDADDLWLPSKIENQLSALDDPAVEGVFALGQNMVSADRAEELRSLHVDTTVRPAFLPSALLVRRSTLEAIGPFATEGALTDWVDWYFRLVESGRVIAVVDELLTIRRVHGDNATLADPAAKFAYVRLLKASLDRRRRSAVTHNSEGYP
jgi:hypothetical protein